MQTVAPRQHSHRVAPAHVERQNARLLEHGNLAAGAAASRAEGAHQRSLAVRTPPPGIEAVLNSPGETLDSATRAYMEPRFGHDFSQVRVHTDETAAQSAWEVGAQAFVVGGHMVFGTGKFAPQTHDGQRLIAHELAHVVQQTGGVRGIQRSPETKSRWSNDASAARYRGRVMAKRLRTHTKLSKEARAKINEELGMFEGAAKEAYLKEVKPALMEVNPIEMPTEWMVPEGPKPMELFSRQDGPEYCGGAPCATAEKVLGPEGLNVEARQETEPTAKNLQFRVLKEQTKGWGAADQKFAHDLLRQVFKSSNPHDMGAIADTIRQPILDHYKAWLEANDKARLDDCARRSEPSMFEKAIWRFHGEPLCESWFATEHSHGPNELIELQRMLKIDRNSGRGPADKVYQDLFEYRKKVDPELVLAGMRGQALMGVATGAADLGGRTGEIAGGSHNAPPAGVPAPRENVPGSEKPAGLHETLDTESPKPRNDGNGGGGQGGAGGGGGSNPWQPKGVERSIEDPVEAAQMFYNQGRAGKPARLLGGQDREMMRDVWSHDYGQTGEPPMAWVDSDGNIVIDASKVPVALTGSQVPSGPVGGGATDIGHAGTHPATEKKSGGSLGHADTERAAGGGTKDDSQAPKRSGPPSGGGGGTPWQPKGVRRHVSDPVEAAQIYYEQSRGGKPARLLGGQDRELMRDVWSHDYGQTGEPPAAWIDSDGNIVIDASKVPVPLTHGHVPAGPVRGGS